MAGRVIDAGLVLLDRQILDRKGRMAGNVDDLELTFPAGGKGPPIVTAILSGPGALAGRLGGRLGSWLESVQRRLHHEEEPGPARLPFGVVKRIADHVEISLDHEELESNLLERWAAKHVIDRIPGAGRAPE